MSPTQKSKDPQTVSIFNWLNRVREAFPFYNRMFIGRVWEGEFILWPPSLEYYSPEAVESAKSKTFSCQVNDSCFFRICTRSLMPYHGYIVPSNIHDKLFKFLKTTIPEHVTLFPILHQDEIIAIHYLEKTKITNVSKFPSISRMELQWDMLSYLFAQMYHPRYENVIPFAP